jgi:hypothetical protein
VLGRELVKPARHDRLDRGPPRLDPVLRPRLASAAPHGAVAADACCFRQLSGRGGGTAHAAGHPLLEETEEGLAGSGEVVMMEAGAGAPLD